MFGNQVPVEPCRIAVLAIRVVVPVLTAPHLIAHCEHWHSGRQHDGGKEVLHLPIAKPLDSWIVRRTFDTAVPASVLVRSIAVAIAVFFIVLVVVGDEVVQRKAVVAGDEVDALLRLALFPAVNTRTAKQTIGRSPGLLVRATEEVAHVVAKPVVPLLPAVAHEVADLIESCRIPCFGDHLRSGQRRVGLDIP